MRTFIKFIFTERIIAKTIRMLHASTLWLYSKSWRSKKLRKGDIRVIGICGRVLRITKRFNRVSKLTRAWRERVPQDLNRNITSMTARTTT